MPFQIAVMVEVDFDDNARPHTEQLQRELESKVEQAIDEGIEGMADLAMPIYTNVHSEVRE